MTTIAQLCASLPAATDGYEIGYEDYRLAVFAAVPATADANVWGVGVWGTFKWSNDWEWLDLTGRLYGLETDRGTSSPSDRPRVGLATITLNNDDGLLAPWADLEEPWLAEGTVVQVVAWSPTEAVAWPQFTGIIETITEGFASDLDATRIVTVTAAETLADLAGLVEPTSPAVGEGESPEDRLNRLLPTSWRFGADVDELGPLETAPFLQATTKAGNRLAECYLVADSVALDFRAGRDGKATLALRYTPVYDFPVGVDGHEIGFGEGRYSIDGTVSSMEVFPASSIEVYSDDDSTVGLVSYARVGGTVQVVDGGVRSGARGISRSDLLLTTDAGVLELAQHDYDRLAGSRLRCRISVNAWCDWTDTNPLAPRALMALDLSQTVTAWREFARTTATGHLFRCWIVGLAHRITVVAPGQVTWDTTITTVVSSHTTEGDLFGFDPPLGP